MGKKNQKGSKKDHSRGRVHVRRLFSTQRTVFVWLFLAFSFFCSFSFTSLLQLSPCISHESFYFYLPYLPPYITSSTFYRRTKLNSTPIIMRGDWTLESIVSKTSLNDQINKKEMTTSVMNCLVFPSADWIDGIVGSSLSSSSEHHAARNAVKTSELCWSYVEEAPQHWKRTTPDGAVWSLLIQACPSMDACTSPSFVGCYLSQCAKPAFVSLPSILRVQINIHFPSRMNAYFQCFFSPWVLFSEK